MLVKEMVEKLDKDMKETLVSTRHELAQIRTGRASSALVDGINVECYGGRSPLKQVAGISVPEARLILIQPYDKSLTHDIEKALQKSDLGINPTSDGKVIRLQIPPLTEERRRELVKHVKKLGEEGKIKLRNLRRDANEEIKLGEKDGDIPEDHGKRTLDKIQKITDDFVKQVEEIIHEKSKEITEF